MVDTGLNTVIDNANAIKPVMDLIYGFQSSRLVFSALELGVFECFHQSDCPQTAKDVSDQLSTNPGATVRFLDALVGLGVLNCEIPSDKNAGKVIYSNSPGTEQFLVASSPDSIVALARSSVLVYPMFMHLESAVREGTSQWKRVLQNFPGDFFQKVYQSEEKMVEFMGCMHGTLRQSRSWILQAFDLSQYSTICDLGGCSGCLSYAATVTYPKNRIISFDLPPVTGLVPRFRPSRGECPNQSEVEFVPGDFFTDELPKADLYILSRVLHDFPEDKIDALLSKIFKTLPSGGALLIAETHLKEDKSSSMYSHHANMVTLLFTEGRERTANEYQALLEKHGFVEAQAKDSGTPYVLGVVKATKRQFNVSE